MDCVNDDKAGKKVIAEMTSIIELEEEDLYRGPQINWYKAGEIQF